MDDIDRHYLDIAACYAETWADCTRAQVGALVVYQGAVIGFGANAAPTGTGLSCTKGDCPRGKLTFEQLPAGSPYGNCIAVHAEFNAILEAKERLDTLVLPSDCVLYTTREPCEGCAVVIRNHRIKRVVVKNGSLH